MKVILDAEDAYCPVQPGYAFSDDGSVISVLEARDRPPQ